MVSSSPLPEDADAGEEQIKRFLEAYEDGQVDLISVFQRLENDQLGGVPQIAEMARLKGINI